MARPPRVALLIETSNAYARGLVRGIEAYIRERQPWSLYLPEVGRGSRPPEWLDDWTGDGVIARIENAEIAEALRGRPWPIVDLSAARQVEGVPFFETNDQSISRMAAGHLLERGFRQFAFVGDPRFVWSGLRQKYFVEAIKEAGFPCHVYTPPSGDVPAPAPSAKKAAKKAAKATVLKSRPDPVDEIARWLAKLPRPLAIMACYDIRGQQVLDACRRLDLAVPEQVAVVGVDNDELLCHLSSPALSSVIPNTRRTGYEAAALLDQMMQGLKPGPLEHFIPPIGVATRQSTDVLAIEDPNIAKALRFIREHACDGIRVEDVVKAAHLSRRLLENRFRKLLSRTPHEEILRVQLNRVKQLLSETNLTMAEIADRTGFEHVEYLSVVFKKKVGLPPSQYRAESRM